jgi:hypothetical protein
MDLLVHDKAHRSLTKPLTSSLLDVAPVRAERWASTAPTLGHLFQQLRRPLSSRVRADTINELRAVAKATGLYENGSW